MLTWIEINTQAFTKNIKALRKQVGKNVALMPVIKSNAYGHGLLPVAQLCEAEPEVDRLCVAGIDEALTLVRSGITKPIIVLSFFDFDKDAVAEAIASRRISFPLYNLEQAQFLETVATPLGCSVNAHLKIDTGTSRVGVLPSEAVSFCAELQKFSHLRLEGVFSHFSSSEEDKRVTAEQQYIFGEVIRSLEEQGFSPEFKHIACSASTLLYKQTHENAVRPGIALYGLHPSTTTQKITSLTPVLSFKTKIIACKAVGKGTAIGYGQSYVTPKSTTIVTLPIGYFDGFDRGFSNTGEVLIHGIRCRVRGRVCMNLTMVEVPKSIAARVKIGDEVVVLGVQKKERITAEEWAQKLGTISYEVVTRLGAHIPRMVVGKKSVVTST